MRMIQRVCFPLVSTAQVTLGLMLFVAARPAFAQGTWATKAPNPTPVNASTATVAGGKVYTVGGQTPSNALTLVESYDPSTNSWSTVAPLPSPVDRAAAAEVNGTLYVVGGCADTGCGALLNTVSAYDPSSNTWTLKAPIPTPRRDFGIAVVNGILYAIGGNQGPGITCLASVEAYNPSTNAWTAVAPLPLGRITPSVTAANGILYAIGGSYCGGPFAATPTAEVDAYNPASNTWRVVASLPAAVTNGMAAAINGNVHAVGGLIMNSVSTCCPPTSQNLAYDPATNAWTPQAPLPTARHGLGGGVINGILYAVGGFDSTGTLVGTNEAFTPPPKFSICPLYDQTRSVQSGAVYPIKVALCDVNGTDVSSSTVVLHATAVTKVSVFVGTPDSPGNANPDNDFRFDSTLGTTGGYIFNLSTSGLASGTYSLQFTATGDPVTHSVNFGVK